MAKEETTRHRLTSGGFGRWENAGNSKNFIDYQTGQIVENLSKQALEFHGDRFDLVVDDTSNGSENTDVVAEILKSKVVDVAPMIQAIDDRQTLHLVLDQDRRPKVQGLARSRLKALPKE